MRILKLSHFLLLATIFFIANCIDHELINPFDLNCPKEIFTPSNLIAEQSDDGIKLNWEQTNTQISGFIISRSENDGTITEIVRVEKTVTLWNDNDVVDRVKYDYQLLAYAGENLSNPQSISITPIFSSSITTSAATNVTFNSAVLGGNVNDEGSSAVNERGICYSTTQNPTIVNNKVKIGSGKGVFSTTVSELNENTMYYVRAFAINSYDVTYGAQISFTTQSLLPPTAITNAAANITPTAATLNGTVNANEQSTTVTFEYGTTTSYGDTAIASLKAVNGNVITPVSAMVGGLTGNTTYHFRLKAENATGITYGSDQVFTTPILLPPTVTTMSATNINRTNAILGGDVISEGESAVTERGICYNTTKNPTIANHKIVMGSGLGVFRESVSDLTKNTTYYVRAYAINNLDTAYGEPISFTTSNLPPTSATTNDAYKLTVTSARLSGTVDSEEQSTIVTFEYGITTEYGTSVSASESPVTGSTTSTNVTADISGLTKDTKYHFRVKAVNLAGTTYGKNMIFYTLAPPTASTNSATSITKTTATLNGMINANDQNAVVTFEYGTTTDYGNQAAPSPNVFTGSSNTNVSVNISDLTGNTTYHFRIEVFSVVAAEPIYGSDQTFTTSDHQPNPTTITGSAINIDYNTATLTGLVNADGYSLSASFYYYGANDTTWPQTWISANQNPVTGNTDQLVSTDISGLTENSVYFFRVRAYNSDFGYVWGEYKSFTTIGPEIECSDFEVTHTAGEVAPVTKTVIYKTAITSLSGKNKCWLTQNLGADREASSTVYSTEEEAGWYWQFNQKQGYKFDGTNRIPNNTWITSISEASNWTSVNDPCTILLGSGWRIPTEFEWRKVKEMGNFDTINDAFSSVLKLNNSGTFSDQGSDLQLDIGGYWSSTQNSFARAEYFRLYNSYGPDLTDNYKTKGVSIRCLKD